jgi:hypothetical protein
MIANQDKNKNVLVGQVKDKAMGMLSVSTDVNVLLLIKNITL